MHILPGVLFSEHLKNTHILAPLLCRAALPRGDGLCGLRGCPLGALCRRRRQVSAQQHRPHVKTTRVLGTGRGQAPLPGCREGLRGGSRWAWARSAQEQQAGAPGQLSLEQRSPGERRRQEGKALPDSCWDADSEGRGGRVRARSRPELMHSHPTAEEVLGTLHLLPLLMVAVTVRNRRRRTQRRRLGPGPCPWCHCPAGRMRASLDLGGTCTHFPCCTSSSHGTRRQEGWVVLGGQGCWWQSVLGQVSVQRKQQGLEGWQPGAAPRRAQPPVWKTSP